MNIYKDYLACKYFICVFGNIFYQASAPSFCIKINRGMVNMSKVKIEVLYSLQPITVDTFHGAMNVHFAKR